MDITHFFQKFEGTFQGVKYAHRSPPARYFSNSKNCRNFVTFINDEIVSRLKSGAVTYLGQVGKVKKPLIVSPLTVEPTKPRLCLNLMYINCFMKDTPFTLDTLYDVPLAVHENSYITKLDDKSGYDHVFMTESSRDYLCFQWGGHYFRCNTLPFGWKNSAYVYHTINLSAMSFLRQRGVNGLIYIDDRLIEEYKGPLCRVNDNHLNRSTIAIRYAIMVLGSLGYFLNVSKSVIIPTRTLTFLGLEIDTSTCSFYVPEKRKLKIACVREYILSKETVHIRTIQKFVGLCVSTVLAVPGAKLFTAACNRAIAAAESSFTQYIPLSSELQEEVTHWKFLDTWVHPFPWVKERHLSLKLFTDASNYKWGAVLTISNNTTEFADFWSPQEATDIIMVKEAAALLKALYSVNDKIRNARVSVYIDNFAVVDAWKKQYSKNRRLNEIFKQIFHFVMETQCFISLTYVPSKENDADAPSRKLSKSDCTITKRVWAYLEYRFGPHDIDMFALDSNVMRDIDGKPLKHFSLYPTPSSAGVDALAQIYTTKDNCYAFPPFSLLPAVVKFIIEEKLQCSLVFPYFQRIPIWMLKIKEHAYDILTLGYAGDKGVILYPSKSGYLADKVGLPWNLMCARFNPSVPSQIAFDIETVRPTCFTPVLLIGDSIVRFMTQRCTDTQVLSVGGAKILDSYMTLRTALNDYSPQLIILHSGTNNINKSYSDLSTAIDCSKFVLERIKCLQAVHRFVVVISACLRLRENTLLHRVELLNAAIRTQCKIHGFIFVLHDNFTADDFRDDVHLNIRGQEKLLKNFKGFVSVSWVHEIFSISIILYRMCSFLIKRSVVKLIFINTTCYLSISSWSEIKLLI